jgi:nucleotide-binding universal stress UspA family protein
MPTFKNILHPTDFSDNSQSAFEMACILAKDQNASLILLHVVTNPVPVSPMLNTPTPEEAKAIQRPWPEPPVPSLRMERRLVQGDAAEQIVVTAIALKCDLIVMDTHGRTGLRHLLTGSVAEQVMRNAPCPVMVVKMPVA